MNKQYESPNITICNFSAQDVVRTSTVKDGYDWLDALGLFE